MTKCNICNQRKAKRSCMIRNGELICSLCCAETRNSSCAGCSFYETSKKYEREKMQRLSEKERVKHFIFEWNEEANLAADNALNLIERGRIAKAEKVLKKLIDKYPQIHTVAYAMGTLLSVKGEMEAGLKYFNQALSIYPYFEEASYNKAITLLKMLRIADAVTELRELIGYADREDEIYLMAQTELKETEDIIQRTEGVSLDNYVRASRLFDNAFDLLSKNKEFSKAVSLFEESLRYKPQSCQCHGNIGLCYMFMGQKANAIAALERSVEIDPKYEVAIVNLALANNMTEGVPVEGNKQTINYSKDYQDKEPGAYIQDYLAEQKAND